MHVYTLCGRHGRNCRNEHIKQSCESDEKARAWVRQFCIDHPTFKPFKLSQTVRIGEYREVPLPALLNP